MAIGKQANTVATGCERLPEGKNASGPAVLIDEMPHCDEARLVRLLRLLRVPPLEWVRRAQRIPLTSGTLTDRDVEELGRKLERDPSFHRDFDADPVAAAEAAGLYKMGLRLRQELRALVALAEQIASDEARRIELIAALGGQSEPVASAEPIRELLAVGAPDFEAHGLNTPRPEERLQLLLLTSTAAADELRAAVRRA